MASIDRLLSRLEAFRLRHFRQHHLLQPSTLTVADRHPRLFTELRNRLRAVERPHLLSFGCSTGEEVFALADYFPTATIRGIDINHACIRTARRRARQAADPRLSFACASSAAAEPVGGYDAIFALSVLRHGRLDAERPDDCSAILPFARFAAILDGLDRCLRPGGYMVLWGSNFRFRDTPLMAGYAVEFAMPPKERLPVYDDKNQRLSEPGPQELIFKKLPK